MASKTLSRSEIEDICRQISSIDANSKENAIITASPDLTTRRLADVTNRSFRALQRTAAGARTELEALQSVQLLAGVGTWRFLIGDRRVEWSDTMHRLFGTDKETICPDLDLTLQLAQTTDRTGLKRALDFAQHRGEITSCEWRSRGLGRDSRWFWTEFRPEHNAAGSIIAVRALCQDITRQKTALDAIGLLVRQDTLTGLGNRAALSEELRKLFAAADAAHQKIAAICFDLDGLKTINDIHGYSAGDDVLQEVARRLGHHSRDTDIIARLGSDEFVVIQTGGDQPLAAQSLAERLLKSLAQPYQVSDIAEEHLTASIGIAFYPDDAGAPDALLQHAANALGQAKRDGRNRSALYDPTMEQDQRARLRLEQDLKAALQRQEFSLVYQPLFSTENRFITGFEALLRWDSPEHGRVAPDIFIPIAERIGYMGQIGEWVIRKACKEAAQWLTPLRIAVNVSPVQVQEGGLADTVEQVLRETGLQPDRLELEITETLLLKDTERAINTLQRIRQLGVQIAIDDFGTGYSSLATLRAFPFDKLKVDRSFIKDLGQTTDALAIVQAILGLSRGLRLPVVAEGVETEVQAEILKRFGCDELQGYLLGHPLPIERFSQITGHSSNSFIPSAPHWGNSNLADAITAVN